MSKRLGWYKEGLCFECTGCGRCCSGGPGYVWVSDAEIEAIARHLKITDEECRRRYTRFCKGRISLKENLPSYDCVFLKGKLCSIYEARPTQCRTFPFWPQNLESRETWAEAALSCEGINKEARLVPISEIAIQLAKQEEADEGQ